jgi:catechol 2,3-dioxygenase
MFALQMADEYSIPPQTRIGHAHLKVSDIEKSLAFYCGLLGFELVTRYGPQAAFISAGGYHHHIGLNTWYSEGGSAPPINSTGLFHIAILYPTRKDLAAIFKRLSDHGYPFTGASDHGVSQALYLNDPDGNGIELYWDRPREEWPRKSDGSIEMYTRALDLGNLSLELTRRDQN